MATTSEVLIDAFERVREVVHGALDGAGEAVLTAQVEPGANTLAWLVWHLTRVQDDHVAELAGVDQRWRAGGWAERFDLPYAADATGYGQSSGEVGELRGVSAEQLGAYLDDVHQATLRYLEGVGDHDLDAIVDRSYDPPVTVGARLVSVISDDLQHAGQAAYVRGVLDRRD